MQKYDGSTIAGIIVLGLPVLFMVVWVSMVIDHLTGGGFVGVLTGMLVGAVAYAVVKSRIAAMVQMEHCNDFADK